MSVSAPAQTGTKTIALRGANPEAVNGEAQGEPGSSVTSSNKSSILPAVWRPYGYHNLQYGAFYNHPTLTLSASGESPPNDYCFGFDWVRNISIPERLSYTLWCYHTYLPPGNGSRIEVNESFRFPVLHGVAPDGRVLLDNQLVDIHYGGLIPPPKISQATSAPVSSAGVTSAAAADAPQPTDKSHERLVFVNDPFQITQPAKTLPGGKITVKYDDTVLRLNGAEIVDKDISWTFSGSHIANTIVSVFVYGGIATYIERIDYHITIISLEPALTAPLPSDSGIMIPYFRDLLMQAQRIVSSHYSDVKFLTAQASHGGGTLIVGSPTNLKIITARFVTSAGHVLISTRGQGLWSKPQPTSIIVGIQTFDIDSINVDLYDLGYKGVQEWLTDHGFPPKEYGYISANLARVLGPPDQGPYEPHYDMYLQQKTSVGELVHVQVPATLFRKQVEA